jgi:hypothetical protein
MAQFCHSFNMSPSEYRSLTMSEFAAFLEVLEKVNEE